MFLHPARAFPTFQRRRPIILRGFRIPCVCWLVFSIVACEADNVPTAPNLGAAAAVVPRSSLYPPASAEAKQLEVAHAVPGFGGLYYDGDVAVINLVDLSRSESARSIIAPLLSARPRHKRDGGPKQYRFQKVNYSFDQLVAWYDQIEPVWNVPEIVSTDIRESRNRISIAVATPEAVGQVNRLLLSLGIPQGAFEIVTDEPITPTNKDLNDRHRPVMPSFTICAGSACNCSSSVNVKLPEQSTVYLVTASHCTPTFGGFDGNPWLQFVEQMGYEALDADWFYCHGGAHCVYADAALLQYTYSDSAAFGKIAKPTLWRSTVVNEQTPLNIFAEEHLVFEGDYVEKLGRADGYSHNYVTLTCYDSVLTGVGVVLCANKASYWSCPGDSGGVIFDSGFPWVPSTTTAVYWGINFGKQNSGPSCGGGVFSGIAQIELAYGNLITY